MGQASQEAGGKMEAAVFQQRLSTLPLTAQYTLRHALASLASQLPMDRPDEPLLLKLAEHLAIKFALDRYERGEVRVNAVRQMLDRMSNEIDTLRKILGSHEKKLAQAGIHVQSHIEILAQQFWSEVPETTKHTVLTSPDAWCVPPQNLRKYVAGLLQDNQTDPVYKILANYSSCISREETEARRFTAMGLAELADLYMSGDGRSLTAAIREAGNQLNAERDAELQTLVGAAFVRLSQEAAAQRFFPAMLQALDSLGAVEIQRPAFAQSLRPRVGIEERLPEFIEDALRAERVPPGLPDLLRRLPKSAADCLSARFNQCGFREDGDLILELFRQVGPEGALHLRETLRAGAANQAVEAVGLLSRCEPGAVEQWLPPRMGDLQRAAHDRIVRQIAASGARETAHLLLVILDTLDPWIRPLALDEIGMAGDSSAIPQLLQLATADSSQANAAYLRLKAIEALGRLRAAEAADLLHKIVESKQVWRWTYPAEMRIVAFQALGKLGPSHAPASPSRVGFNETDLGLAPLDRDPQSPCIRQRRYPRIRLLRPVSAVSTNLRENCRLEIQVMDLAGGIATGDRPLPPGTLMTLKIGSGRHAARARTLVRSARAQAVAFEIVDIDLEDRYKLRRLVAESGGGAQQASLESRGRRRGRSVPTRF